MTRRRRLLWTALLTACAAPGTDVDDTDVAATAHTDLGADSDGGAGPSDTLVDGTPQDSDGPVDPCAPPDRWIGPVEPSLYVTTPYPSSYDSGLAAVAPKVGDNGSGLSTAIVLLDATVELVFDLPNGDAEAYLADGVAATTTTFTEQRPLPGDRIVVAVGGGNTFEGVSRVGSSRDVHVDSQGNPVYVQELGANPVGGDYPRLTHAYGELTARSNLDCSRKRTCFLFVHQGTEDRIRVPTVNDFGLDIDYQGGLCAEVVAPAAGMYTPGSVLRFLDVTQPTMMRVWRKR